MPNATLVSAVSEAQLPLRLRSESRGANRSLVRCLERQQSALPIHPSRITGERAIRTDHAMAGYDKGYGISSSRGPGSSYAARSAERSGQCPVADGFSARNGGNCAPHPLLEGRAFEAQRQIECSSFACEIFIQLSLGDRKRLRYLALNPILRGLCNVFLSDEIQTCKTASVRHQQHCAERTIDVCEVLHGFGFSRECHRCMTA